MAVPKDRALRCPVVEVEAGLTPVQGPRAGILRPQHVEFRGANRGCLDYPAVLEPEAQRVRPWSTALPTRSPATEPICTVRPSRPSTRLAPIASSPRGNLTGRTSGVWRESGSCVAWVLDGGAPLECRVEKGAEMDKKARLHLIHAVMARNSAAGRRSSTIGA